MQPNANLTATHLFMFSLALVAIFGWGLVCLEADLARSAPVVIAAGK